MKKTLFFVTILITFSFFACNKKEYTSEDSIENLEEKEDNFSQEEEIVPIELSPEIRDGRMVFATHAEMVNTLDALLDYNLESIREWEKKIGFNSIFSEYQRIADLDIENQKLELEKGRLKDFFKFGENGLEPILYSMYVSRMLNTDGIVQVGNHVGTIGHGVTIWTKEENIDQMINILSSKTLPTDRNDLIIIDETYFINHSGTSVDTRGSYNISCPLDTDYSSPTVAYSKPNSNRRIVGQWNFIPLTTMSPTNSNQVDYSAKFTSNSTSHKGCCKYKTIHAYSYDLVWERFNLWMGQTTRTNSAFSSTAIKYYEGSITLLSFTGVTVPFLEQNGARLVSVYSYSTNGSGTYVSHRGMGVGNELNFSCL